MTARSSSGLLQSPGWTEPVRHRLESLILAGSRKGLPVVFDFDNTLVCGDIGEATLAVLVKSGVLNPAQLPKTLFPKFERPGTGLVELSNCADLTEYYERFLDPTSHDGDSSPHANSYVLAAEVMSGLSPLQIVDATRRAYGNSRTGQVRSIEVSPGRTAYPAPYFYPEMVELLACLLQHRFDVWIVSASNVWSVRWMVLKALPPLLRKHGVKRSIPPERVVGISLLLSNARHRLFKDPMLVRESSSYAVMERGALGRYQLTSRLHFPVSTYSGKIACILDQIGEPPYLCVGDSPGDLPMLKFSQHRLWVARLEKDGDQRAALRAVRETGPASWMVQPTLTKASPGFVASRAQLETRTGLGREPIKASLAFWGEIPWCIPEQFAG